MKLLCDGNHLASRCRFAKVGDLTTSDGRRSGTIYGFLKGISFAAHEFGLSLSDVIVCWDGGSAEGRLALCPEYKGNRRKDMTEQETLDLKAYFSQMDALRVALPTLGVKCIKIRGAEADDLISILAHLNDKQVVIYSGDKDFWQLLTENITIFDRDKGIITEQLIKEKWGIESLASILRFRAIVGDASDNISGVPKVGDKRAALVVNGPKEGDEKHNKQFEKWNALVLSYMDIVTRNEKVMRLPKCLEESFYTTEQAEQMFAQYTQDANQDPVEFVKFCQSWELKSLLDEAKWN